MSLRAPEIRRLIPELNDRLSGQPIRRVFQQDSDTLLFRTRAAVLCVSVHPQASRIHLLPALPTRRIPVSAFAQLLRRRLEGTRVSSLWQPGMDRAVRLELQGPAVSLSLVAELTGRHGNVFLLEDEQILGSLRSNRSRRRANVPGARYAGLIPHGGSTPGGGAPREPAPGEPALLTPAPPGPEPRESGSLTPAPPGPEPSGSASNSPAPTESAAGTWRFGDHCRGPSAAVAAYYAPRLATWARQARVASLARPLKRQLRQKRRLAHRLAEDLARHQEALGHGRAADLLLAQPHAVPRGAEKARLKDLFAPDPEQAPTVEIRLDPRYTPVENAQRYYRQASRARRGVEQVEARQQSTVREIVRLERALAALEEADDEALAELERSAEQVTAAVQAAGTGREHQRRGRRRPKGGGDHQGSGRSRPWHTFRSKTGLPILVGRSARDNDQLTFRHARGRDVWLHARDVPGAHVVLRLDAGGEPDHQSLLDAAALAAHFSDARQEPSAEVSWTQVKHLRRGHSPGQVYLSREHTLRVRSDAGRLARLRSSTSAADQTLSLLLPETDPSSGWHGED